MRPPPADSFDTNPSGTLAVLAAGALPADAIHCALATRRGRPSTRTVKSAAMRSRIGCPLSSTTVTSTGSASTPARKLGVCASWACGTRETLKRMTRRTEVVLTCYVSLRRDRTISLPGADAALSVDPQRDLPEHVVALRVGRFVSEQVLVRQLFEQVGEGEVQLVDVVGGQRASAGRLDQTVHDRFERLHFDAAALSNHVERDVARLQPAFHVGNRGVAALIFAVGEDDHGAAARLLAEHVHAAQDD